MPFEIPENWEWTTIEDIAESNIGLTYKPTDICGNGVPVYRSNNIQNRRICLKELVRVNTNILEKQYLQEGDLLICARNGSRNLVGKCAIIDNLNEPTSFGAFMAVCRSALNPWIFQILNSEYFNTYLDDSNSTAINQVTQKMLLAFQLPIPPAAEQERIISKLKQWYEYIDEIEDRKIELESYIKQTKSKILDLAISGKLVSQDPNDEPAIELLKRINPGFKPCDNSHYENLPFEIPSNWVWASHNDILEISGGAQPPKSEFSEVMKPGYIRLYQIRDYGEKPIPIYIPLSTASKTTVKGDILLARYGGSLGKVFIAEDGAYNVAMAKVIFCYPEILNRKFVYYYYLSSIYQNKLRSISRTAQAGFNSGDFEDMYFPLPPLNEQERIVDAISSIWEMIDMITAEL